jgi:hypothetical protein
VPCNSQVSDKDEEICAALSCGAQKEILAWWSHFVYPVR